MNTYNLGPGALYFGNRRVGTMIPETSITYTDLALEDTEERLFPTSRHRSARILKKLIKRHGGEYRRRPCVWSTARGIIAHPALRAMLEASTQGDGK